MDAGEHFKKISGRMSHGDIQKQIADNFVSLQRVMTNLALKFDALSDNISKLLQLFEIAAKSFVEKNSVEDKEKDKEFLGKIDTLLDQNKTLAKGISLMEERMREKVYGAPPNMERPRFPRM